MWYRFSEQFTTDENELDPEFTNKLPEYLSSTPHSYYSPQDETLYMNQGAHHYLNQYGFGQSPNLLKNYHGEYISRSELERVLTDIEQAVQQHPEKAAELKQIISQLQSAYQGSEHGAVIVIAKQYQDATAQLAQIKSTLAHEHAHRAQAIFSGGENPRQHLSPDDYSVIRRHPYNREFTLGLSQNRYDKNDDALSVSEIAAHIIGGQGDTLAAGVENSKKARMQYVWIYNYFLHLLTKHPAEKVAQLLPRGANPVAKQAFQDAIKQRDTEPYPALLYQ